MEIDLDGDCLPDVVVPGLGDDGGEDEPPELHPGRGDTEEFESTIVYDAPPTTNVLTPMGQIEQLGYALRSRTGRTGWRRTVIVVFAWTTLAIAAGGLVVALLR